MMLLKIALCVCVVDGGGEIKFQGLVQKKITGSNKTANGLVHSAECIGIKSLKLSDKVSHKMCYITLYCQVCYIPQI